MKTLQRLFFLFILFFAFSAKPAVFIPGSGGGGTTLSITSTGTYAFQSPLIVNLATNIFLPLELANLVTNKAITNIPVSKMLFVDPAGNNTTAQRGRIDKPWSDPRAAVLAASAGDLVQIRPGFYNTNNLWKPGVNIHAMAGSYIGKTNVAPGLGIIDDRNGLGAGTNTFLLEGIIAFESDLSSDTKVDGPIVITNANTIAVIKGNRIEGQLYDVRTFGVGLLVVLNCRYVSFDFDYLTDNMNGINDSYASICYWENGQTHVNFRKADMDNGYGFWFKEPAGTPSSDIYVTGQKMTTAVAAGNPLLVQFTGTNANWKSWIDIQEINSPGGGGYGVAMDGTGGKLYLNSLKVGNANTALRLTGGEFWGTGQKVSVADGTFVSATGGTSFNSVQHYEDTHTIASAGAGFTISGGTHNFNPGVARVVNAKGLDQSGGTSVWKSVTIDTVGTNQLLTASNNVPIYVSGGRVELHNVNLIAPTNAYSIDAPSAQTVYVYGTLTVNRPVSPNITIATIVTNYIVSPKIRGPVESTGDLTQLGNSYFDAAVDSLQGTTWTLPHVVVQDDLTVPDDAYDATSWNGSLLVPTKNAIRDKIESLVVGGGTGDMFGPAAVTDKQVVIYGGTGGDRTTNSPVTIDPVTGAVGGVGSLVTTGLVQTPSLIVTNPVPGSYPSAIDLKSTNGVNKATIQAAPEVSFDQLIIVGVLEKAAASVVEFPYDRVSELMVTNPITAAITLVGTNGVAGRKGRFKIRADGTDRVFNYVPNTGQLVANMNSTNTAMATSYSETIMAGFDLEGDVAIDKIQGTNTHYLVTRQSKR